MHTDPPEERLLRLIRGSRNKPGDANPVESRSKGARFFRFIKKALLVDGQFKAASLSLINKILILILIILTAYFIPSLFVRAPRDIDSVLKKGEVANATLQDVDLGGLAPSKADIPLATEKQLQEKPLFGASGLRESDEAKTTKADLYKKFNLLGIIGGDQPQAIIKDEETQKTYYLYKGQSFDDTAVVNIEDKKVTLSCRGEEITLSL